MILNDTWYRVADTKNAEYLEIIICNKVVKLHRKALMILADIYQYLVIFDQRKQKNSAPIVTIDSF